MRNKAPGTAATGPHEFRINNVRDARNAKDLVPEFRYDLANLADPNGGKKLWLRGKRSHSQDSCIVIPFRERGPESDLVLQQICILDDWLLDLSTTGIDLDNRIGGLIDDQPLVTGDYWIYAFLDPTQGPASQFQGFGLMRRPASPYTSLAGTGLKGGTNESFLFAGFEGTNYAPGARVLLQQTPVVHDTGPGSITSNPLAPYPVNGSPYNQGQITITGGNKIFVDLDNSFIIVGGRQVGYGSALTTGTITGNAIQLTDPAPYKQVIGTISALYPAILPAGGGLDDIIEYQFCYMGSVYVDAALNIGYQPRHRGDINYNAGGRLFEETVTATTFYNRHLMRYMPTHALEIEIEPFIERTSGGAGSGAIQVTSNENDLVGVFGGSDSAVTNQIMISRDEIEMAPYSGAVSIVIIEKGTATLHGIVTMRGYRETEW